MAEPEAPGPYDYKNERANDRRLAREEGEAPPRDYYDRDYNDMEVIRGGGRGDDRAYLAYLALLATGRSGYPNVRPPVPDPDPRPRPEPGPNHHDETQRFTLQFGDKTGAPQVADVPLTPLPRFKTKNLDVFAVYGWMAVLNTDSGTGQLTATVHYTNANSSTESFAFGPVAMSTMAATYVQLGTISILPGTVPQASFLNGRYGGGGGWLGGVTFLKVS